jgi:transposase
LVVEVISGLSAMSWSYHGLGSARYNPALLLGILIYGYATGFSSRKLGPVTYDTVAFRLVALNQHSDHDAIDAFRRRFLKDVEKLFVHVLMLVREMGMLKVGTVRVDRTEIHANAGRHSALSHEHAGKIKAQLKTEVVELIATAEAADQADLPDGLSLLDELARHEERLRKLAEARGKLKAAAKKRFEQETAEHRGKLATYLRKSQPARDRFKSGRFLGIREPSPSGPRPGQPGNAPCRTR